MASRMRLLLLGGALLAVRCEMCVAGEPSIPAGQAAPLSDAEISGLCRELGAADYAVREHSTARLTAAGASAVPRVLAAAESGGLETATRAVRVLQALYETGDEVTQDAALAALETLSESTQPALARRAAAALYSKVTFVAHGRQVRSTVAVRLRGGRRAEISVGGGVVTIKGEEPGLRVSITHRDGQEIMIALSELTDGQSASSAEYRAASEAELKERHPEIHELFVRYYKPAAVKVLEARSPPGRPFRMRGGPNLPMAANKH